MIPTHHWGGAQLTIDGEVADDKVIAGLSVIIYTNCGSAFAVTRPRITYLNQPRRTLTTAKSGTSAISKSGARTKLGIISPASASVSNIYFLYG